jgi:hypothetical protein
VAYRLLVEVSLGKGAGLRPSRVRLAGGLILMAALTAGQGCRFRADSASSSLFEQQDVLRLRLEAPFNTLFAHIYDGEDYSVAGTLLRDDGQGPMPLGDVKVSVRGNSSKDITECTFPKLKLKWASSGERPMPPPFAGLKTFKINTHCGERPDGDLSPGLGRWANEKSPHREALVYRLLAVMRVRTLQARPARIEYVYTDPDPDRKPDQRRPFERDALFLEDDDDARKRLGGEASLEEFTDGRRHFSAVDALNVAFGQAMVGNFDWCLKFAADDPRHCDDNQLLYNVLAFRGGRAAAFPVIYDFDLAGMVAGRHRWFDDTFGRRFLPSGSAVQIEAISQVQQTRSLFTRAELDAARARFKRHQADAYRVLDQASVDPEGRAIIRAHLNAFFLAINADHDFYRPVVSRSGEYAYAEAAALAPVCAAQGPIPVGTPVGRTRAAAGGMIQVDLLDLFQWAKPCPAMRSGSVWVRRAAISTDFPK